MLILKKKVFVVGTVGLPACYGGFETLVDNLIVNKSSDIEYTVFCSKMAYSNKLDSYRGASLIYLPFKANGPQSIIYDFISLLISLIKRPEVILILGVSGCLFLPLLRVFCKSKIIVNIDGLEWRRDKWGYFSKHFLKISEFCAVKSSDVVVSDNKALQDYIYNSYKIDSITIPYGGEHAVLDHSISTLSIQSDFYLSVCRIEPENNVHVILDAFSKLKCKLKFIGNWASSEYGKKLYEKYSAYKNIELINPTYDIDVLYSYRSLCIGYIHGHSAGGTNPSLVEIMHFSKAVFAFDCVFNRYTTDDEAFYFSNSDDLIDNINSITIEQMNTCGFKLKELANNYYTWFKVNELYESIY